MSPRSKGKTIKAGAETAKVRLTAARAFVLVAELVYAEPDDPALPLRGVAAAVAVLGGIAAADAICCIRLGEMFRGEDHAQAVGGLGRVARYALTRREDALRWKHRAQACARGGAASGAVSCSYTQ